MSRAGAAVHYDYLFKSILVGASGSGKTCLLDRLCSEQFVESSGPTVGVGFAAKLFEVNSRKVKLQIWDTAGDERYRSIIAPYYKGVVIALLVIDFSKIDSLATECDAFWQRLKDLLPMGVEVGIIVNKMDCDLEGKTFDHASDKNEYAIKQVTQWLRDKQTNLDSVIIQCCSTSKDSKQQIQACFASFVQRVHARILKNPQSESMPITAEEIHSVEDFAGKVQSLMSSGVDSKCAKTQSVALLTALIAQQPAAAEQPTFLTLLYELYQALQEALYTEGALLASITQERGLLRGARGRTSSYEAMSNQLAEVILNYYLEQYKSNQIADDDRQTVMQRCHTLQQSCHGRYAHFFGMTPPQQKALQGKISSDNQLADKEAARQFFLPLSRGGHSP